MCGIVGYANLNGRHLTIEQDAPMLQRMGSAIEHRGPDDTQLCLWENVGILFKRLSIVDISTGGQPFHTPDGRISAVINGEIYNHHEIRVGLKQRHCLQTASDCEVVPYLYLDHGLDLFTQVNGMFAVALLDRQERRLLLGRDRLGIKPLFYFVAPDSETLVFASELKGLFAYPKAPRYFDWQQPLPILSS